MQKVSNAAVAASTAAQEDTWDGDGGEAGGPSGLEGWWGAVRGTWYTGVTCALTDASTPPAVLLTISEESTCHEMHHECQMLRHWPWFPEGTKATLKGHAFIRA